MAWVNIAAGDYDPDSPITTTLAGAWSNNVAALAAGDAGAPEIEAAALATDAAIAAWVGARAASLTVGAIGTTAYLSIAAGAGTAGPYAAGATAAGSLLRYAGIYSDSGGAESIVSSGTPGGTWRCMGYIPSLSAGEIAATNWMRIS